ncbi:MAG: hypothetical protein K9J27_07150 [Bacteroidales bacterium]|nr:hypothetical protein [Bacteroidales bacterium]
MGRSPPECTDIRYGRASVVASLLLQDDEHGRGKKSPAKNAGTAFFAGLFLRLCQQQVVLSEAKDLLIYTNATEPIRNQCLKARHENPAA